MEPEKTRENDLMEKLIELNALATQMRDVGVDQHEIELVTADFETQWRDDLDRAEREAVRESEIGVAAVVLAQLQDKQIESILHHQTALPLMSKEEQIAYWDSFGSKEKPGMKQEVNTAMTAALKEAATAIRARYDALREEMAQNLQRIESGAQMDLTRLIEEQIRAENRQATRDHADQVIEDVNRLLQEYRDRNRGHDR